MVDLALNPKKDEFPDFKAASITNLYRLFPKSIINIASAILRSKMESNHKKTEDTGNAQLPSKKPLHVYGKLENASKNRNLGIALLIGVGIVLTAIRTRTD